MENKPYKLRVKIRDAEFEAEGEEGLVREQYEMFLGAVDRLPDVDERSTALPLSRDHVDVPNNDVPVSSGTLDRVFSTERDVLSLRILPSTKNRDADALLLLIYGATKLRGEHSVYGTQLMKSARQSGLNIDRVDRVVSMHKGLYMRGGARKGANYTLNNQGIMKAEEILNSMFD